MLRWAKKLYYRLRGRYYFRWELEHPAKPDNGTIIVALVSPRLCDAGFLNDTLGQLARDGYRLAYASCREARDEWTFVCGGPDHDSIMSVFDEPKPGADTVIDGGGVSIPAEKPALFQLAEIIDGTAKVKGVFDTGPSDAVKEFFAVVEDNEAVVTGGMGRPVSVEFRRKHRHASKCTDCGEFFAHDDDALAAALFRCCPKCAAKMTHCCYCTKEYPRGELVNGGHVYCRDCR